MDLNAVFSLYGSAVNPRMNFNKFETGTLRWLNTVLRVVSGNSRDQIRQTNMVAIKTMVHRRRFLKIYRLKFCDILAEFRL